MEGDTELVLFPSSVSFQMPLGYQHWALSEILASILILALEHLSGANSMNSHL